MQSKVHLPTCSAHRQTAATASTVPAASDWSLTLIISSRRYLLLLLLLLQRSTGTVNGHGHAQWSIISRTVPQDVDPNERALMCAL